MKRFFASLLGVVSLLIISGCANVSSAATYGTHEISLKSLETSVNQVLQERKNVDTSQMQLTTGADLTRGQLQFLLTSGVIEEVARENKISITQSEVTAYKESVYKQIGGADKLPSVLVQASIASQNLTMILRRDVIIQKLTDAVIASGVAQADASAAIQEKILSTAKKLKITVNPKYGTWNETSGLIEDTNAAGSAVNK